MIYKFFTVADQLTKKNSSICSIHRPEMLLNVFLEFLNIVFIFYFLLLSFPSESRLKLFPPFAPPIILSSTMIPRKKNYLMKILNVPPLHPIQETMEFWR